jgi:hypothetical protein
LPALIEKPPALIEKPPALIETLQARMPVPPESIEDVGSNDY